MQLEIRRGTGDGKAAAGFGSLWIVSGSWLGHARVMGPLVTGGAGVAVAGLDMDPPMVRFFCAGCRRLSYGGSGWDLCLDCRFRASKKARSTAKPSPKK
jgi:hypothetical protein